MRWFLWIFAWFAAFVGVATAAEIKKVDRPNCGYVLSGRIEKGDLQKLSSSGIDYGDTLCLASDGGNYAEGLAIAEFLIEKTIGTFVDDGEQCFSACANLFMAGNSQEENFLMPRRSIHYRAQLGFHAPYLDLQEGQFSAETVKASYGAGLAAVARVLALGAGYRGEIFPRSLAIEMLKKGPDEVYLIDTIGKARRYKIDVVGLPARPINLKTLCTLCDLYHQESEDMASSDEEDSYPVCTDVSGVRTKTQKSFTEFRFPGFGGEGMYECVIRAKVGKNRAITNVRLHSELVEEGKTRLNDYEFIEPDTYLFYEASTPIGKGKAP